MTTKLMEEILNKENLETAMKAVIANKGSAGVDGMKINELPKFIEEHGEEITDRIRMDGEMRGFAARTLAKVERMGEAEFAELPIYAADEA